jgi:8-oxo-dGTP pyrophosphatase MutT (NUDIX family)
MADLYPETRVAAVAAFNADGKLLLGFRDDVSLWTCPGGHLEDGEQPARGAIRELYEEAGLTPKSLQYLGDGLVKLTDTKVIRVYCFRAEIPSGQTPTGANDPDRECSEWRWVDVALGSLPLEYDKYLYHPNDVLLRLLGLQRGVVQDDREALEQDEFGDRMKVILEQPGMAPCPIEGTPQFVWTQLVRRFPGLEEAAEQGDVEGLAEAINESEAGFVAYGDELNAPRHRYPVEQYDPNIHEDPWIREGDVHVWATTGLRKNESDLPHPFDYANIPPSYQNDTLGPEYEKASLPTKAYFWASHHADQADTAPLSGDFKSHQAKHLKQLAIHNANAAHLAAQPEPKVNTMASVPKSEGSNDEDLPHPFRYGAAAPPNLTETAAKNYLGWEPHDQASAWQDYHRKAKLSARDAGAEGQASKHAALEQSHAENWKHLKPEECEHCGSDTHTTDQHEACATCDSNDHATEDHPCDYCGSTHHGTDDHECEKCGGEGHDGDSCEAESCDHCGSYSHSTDECDAGTDGDEESGESERGIGWRHEVRDENKPIGPLGEHVLKQIGAHGNPHYYDHNNIRGGKYRHMDQAITRKLADGAAHPDDLYRSYKHTPHIGPSLLLKYIVHRVNNLKAYDNKGKAERLDKDFIALHQFGAARRRTAT